MVRTAAVTVHVGVKATVTENGPVTVAALPVSGMTIDAAKAAKRALFFMMFSIHAWRGARCRDIEAGDLCMGVR